MASNYSCNDNQNYFVQAGKTTSRVLAPPGGRTSICLGTYQEPPKKQEAVPAKKQEVTVATATTTTTRSCSATATDTASNVTKDTTTATSPYTDKSKESATTTIAAADNAPVKENLKFQPKNIRVLAPPGGHTSIKLW